MKRTSKQNLFKFCKGVFLFTFFLATWIYGSTVFADNEGPNNIVNIAGNITGAFQSVGKLLMATAYLAGIGFVIASIFKFKQHRDNPTQIPVGTPIALLVIGIFLIFLPGVIRPAGMTIFGGDVNNAAGGYTGNGAINIPGGDTNNSG